MPASLRIIKIVKDIDPITREEKEDYTVEIEVEAEDSGKLAMELAKCPYGDEIVALLQRAEFLPSNATIPNLKEEAAKEEAEMKKHDEETRDTGRDDMYQELIEELRKSTGTKKARSIIAEYKERIDKVEPETESEEDD